MITSGGKTVGAECLQYRPCVPSSRANSKPQPTQGIDRIVGTDRMVELRHSIYSANVTSRRHQKTIPLQYWTWLFKDPLEIHVHYCTLIYRWKYFPTRTRSKQHRILQKKNKKKTVNVHIAPKAAAQLHRNNKKQGSTGWMMRA